MSFVVHEIIQDRSPLKLSFKKSAGKTLGPSQIDAKLIKENYENEVDLDIAVHELDGFLDFRDCSM